MTFTCTATVNNKRVCDMIVGAFEGGSNHWLGQDRIEPITPNVNTLPDKTLVWYGQPEFFAGDFKITFALSDDGEKVLDNAVISVGLSVMAQDYSRHFGDLMRETDDAETADVFLQCCLFGEVVYG